MRWPGIGVLAPLSLGVGIVLNGLGVISAQALDYVAMFSVWWVVWRLLMRRGAGNLASLVFAVGVVGGLIWVQILSSDIRYMPYLLIIPANILMAWMFARSLISDRDAILIDLIKIMGLRPIEPRFRRFVERQCLMWSVMFIGMAAISTLGMIWSQQRPIFAVALSALIVAQILLFAVSHYYAAFRYGRPETWVLTLRTMIRPDVWVKLGVQ